MSALPKIKSVSLTPRSADVLARLDMQDETLLARRRSARHLLRDDRNEEFEIERALNHNRSSPLFAEERVAGGVNCKAHPIIAEQESKLAEVRNRIKLRTESLERDGERKSGAQVRAEFAKCADGMEGLRDIDDVEPRLKKGESHADAIARLDTAIDASTVKRRGLRNGKRTSAEAKTKAEATIRAMAARGKPDVGALFHGGNIGFPKTLVGRNGAQFRYVNDGVALVAWLFEDDLILKLDELIDAEADDANALTVDGQLRALDDVQDELLALHRERAAIVNRLAADGREAFHRPDAPFEAVMMVEIL